MELGSFFQFEIPDMTWLHLLLFYFVTAAINTSGLLDALAPVIRKHFAVDAFGRTDMPNLEKVISDLENSREDHYLKVMVDVG